MAPTELKQKAQLAKGPAGRKRVSTLQHEGDENVAAYAFGIGVLKDYVYAHMWGNIAAANRNESGGELRDEFERKMTPADISAAQKLAREYVKKKYKGC